MDSYMWAVLWLAFAQPGSSAAPMVDQNWDQSLPGLADNSNFTMPISTSASARDVAQETGTGNPDRPTMGRGVLGSTNLVEGASAQPIRWWNETQPLGTYPSTDPLLTTLPQVVAVPAPDAFRWGLAGLGLLALGRLLTANRRRSARVY